MNKLLTYLLSCLIGLVNALFGAGGGLIAVPLFKKLGLSQKEAQASAISVVMPLCIVSITAYYFMGYINFKDALGYVPFGVAGSFVGTRLMKKIPDKILRKLFSAFMIYSGVRMLMR